MYFVNVHICAANTETETGDFSLWQEQLFYRDWDSLRFFSLLYGQVQLPGLLVTEQFHCHLESSSSPQV